MVETIGAFSTGDEARVECPECGYDLRGRSGALCPECGRRLSPEDLAGPFVPWSRQRARGPVRAFWSTVALVLLRYPRFRLLLERPVDYRAAQHFRALVILLLYAPLFATVLGFIAGGQAGDLDVLRFGSVGGALATHLAIHACLVLFLIAVTGIPSYFFHPAGLSVERQNRALALSYYACAPLLLALPAYVAAPVGWHLGALGFYTASVVFLAAGGLFVVVGVVWWFVLLVRFALDALGSRAWRLIVLLVPLWALAAGLLLVVLPCLIFDVAIIAYTLRD